MTCSQSADGKHLFRWSRKQIVRANGERTPQWQRGWYTPGYFCRCGEEAPAALVPALREAEAEVRRLRSLTFGHEPGEQGKLE